MQIQNQKRTKPHCSETFLKLLTDIPAPAVFVWQWLQVVGIFESEHENMDLFKKIAIPLTVLALLSFIISEYQSRTHTESCRSITKPIEKLNQGIIYITAIPVIAQHALSSSLDINPSYFSETSIYFGIFYLFLAGANLELDNQKLSYKQEFQIIKSKFHGLFSALFTLYHCINEYNSETLVRGYTYILMKEIFDLKEKYFNYIGYFFLAWGHANYFYKLYKKDRKFEEQKSIEGKNLVTHPSRSTCLWTVKIPLILSGNILGVGVYFWEWFKITETLKEGEENNQDFKLICLGIMTLSVINEALNARQVCYKKTDTNFFHKGISLILSYISKAPALITIIYMGLNNDQLLTPYTWDQATHLFSAFNWITMSLKLNEGNYPQHTKDIYAYMNQVLIGPLNLLLFTYEFTSRFLLETIGKGLPLIIFNDYIDCPYNILRIMGYLLSLIATIVFVKEDLLSGSTRISDSSSEFLLQRP